jgi:hypothetical protein
MHVLCDRPVLRDHGSRYVQSPTVCICPEASVDDNLSSLFLPNCAEATRLAKLAVFRTVTDQHHTEPLQLVSELRYFEHKLYCFASLVSCFTGQVAVLFSFPCFLASLCNTPFKYRLVSGNPFQCNSATTRHKHRMAWRSNQRSRDQKEIMFEIPLFPFQKTTLEWKLQTIRNAITEHNHSSPRFRSVLHCRLKKAVSSNTHAVNMSTPA